MTYEFKIDPDFSIKNNKTDYNFKELVNYYLKSNESVK